MDKGKEAAETRLKEQVKELLTTAGLIDTISSDALDDMEDTHNEEELINNAGYQAVAAFQEAACRFADTVKKLKIQKDN